MAASKAAAGKTAKNRKKKTTVTKTGLRQKIQFDGTWRSYQARVLDKADA